MEMLRVTESWLRSTWHVQVPFAWLEACVDWILQESGGVGGRQDRVNQQVLEQWLLADLRELAHPVLPACASEAPKTEVSGFYCLQIDSVIDVSQPAYTQLQQWRGRDCSNEQVSAVTQATQRPWEAKPTRMLLLQLTDGVQNLEGMEYRPVPALSASLPPGTKILLHGTVVCRLGVLLLEPENVKVIGGEVEDLLEQNSQGRVLCRMLGLPEEVPQENGEQQVEPRGREEGLSDEELLASLEVDNQMMMMSMVEASADSGFVSRSGVSSRMGPSASLESDRPHRGESTLNSHEPEMDSPEVLEILDQDFDDIPLEELDNGAPPEPEIPTGEDGPCVNLGSGGAFLPHSSSPGQAVAQTSDSNGNVSSAQTLGGRAFPGQALAYRGDLMPLSDLVILPSMSADRVDHAVSAKLGASVGLPVPEGASVPGPSGSSAGGAPRVVVNGDLDSPPFTYLCILLAIKPPAVTVFRVKAFIVTLLGSLRSNAGTWQVNVTISDGSGYLDVVLSNDVLVGLIGFSVSESKALKRDPNQRYKVNAGLQNCQRELVDMCGIMTVQYDSVSSSAVVLRVEEVLEQNCSDLEKRVKDVALC